MWKSRIVIRRLYTSNVKQIIVQIKGDGKIIRTVKGYLYGFGAVLDMPIEDRNKSRQAFRDNVRHHRINLNS